MKRIAALLLAFAMALSFTGCADKKEETVIMTSFYPMYVLTMNVARGAEGVTVKNMASPQTGCLHDYTLTTADMKALSDAQLLVINGADMELFIDSALEALPELNVVDSSVGVELLTDEPHSHDHGDEEHDPETCTDETHDHSHDEEEDDHGEEDGHGHSHDGHVHLYNSHIWMSPENAIIQVNNIAVALGAADPANAALYSKNAAEYAERIMAADGEARALIEPLGHLHAVAFHETFTYFADRYGIAIVATVLTDEQNAPSAAELARAVDEVAQLDATLLMTDGRSVSRTAETVAAETGAAVVELLALLSEDGGDVYTAYERMLVENARIIHDAAAGHTH